MSGPGPGSGTEDELLRICMQGHRRAHTSFEDLFMREAVFLDATDADEPELADKPADSVSVCQLALAFWSDSARFGPALIVLISVRDGKSG